MGTQVFCLADRGYSKGEQQHGDSVLGWRWRWRDRAKECVFGSGIEDFEGSFNLLILAARVCVFKIDRQIDRQIDMKKYMCKYMSNTSLLYTFFLFDNFRRVVQRCYQRLKRGQLITFSRVQGAPKGAIGHCMCCCFSSICIHMHIYIYESVYTICIYIYKCHA